VCRRPLHVRRSAFTRSPLKKSASTELARLHASPAATALVDKSSARGSPLSSAKKRSSVDKTTPRSSRTNISSASSVTQKSADHSAVKKSATEPQSSSRSEKNSSKGKQKNATKQSYPVASLSSSRKTAEGLAKTSTGSRSADASNTALELKNIRSVQQTSTEAISGHQKQPRSEQKASSRPASRLSVCVFFVLDRGLYKKFFDGYTAVVKAVRKSHASDAPGRAGQLTVQIQYIAD